MFKINNRKAILIGFITMIVFVAYFFWNNALSLDDDIPTNYDYEESSSNEYLLEEELSISASNLDRNLDSNATTIQKGNYIYVNLDEMKMYFYRDAKLIKSYPVSGGKPSTPSPTGTWRIISKAEWGEGFGGAWMGFNVPWGKYGIHGTIYPWFIGNSNSSKGCIRMKNADVQDLYKIVPYGTIVKIVHGNPVFRILKSGDVGSDVLEFQKYLKKLGYFQGSCNGRFADNLKTSVSRFQKDNKLKQSGALTRQTRSLIIDYVNLE